ncbi:MAG: GNAT family N-acetyltransferase [Gammaproteobacteria bacterium]|nr:GNAT family N-acetyltransferase [Gammaproteobacteria bacterium]
MAEALDILIRLLRLGDKRDDFHCGDIELDRFFQRYAGQNQFRHYIGATYVAEANGVLTGFVTVSAGEITAENLRADLRKKLPAYPLPILRIARLAVDLRFQNLGIGKLLLKQMFQLALEMRRQVGCVGIVTDAKPEAVDFYTRLGFETLAVVRGDLAVHLASQPLFLPLRLVEEAAHSKSE